MALAPLRDLQGTCWAGDPQPGPARGVPASRLELPKVGRVGNDQGGSAGMAETVKHLTWGIHRRPRPRDALRLGNRWLRLPHGECWRVDTGSGQARQAQSALAVKHVTMGIHHWWWGTELGPLLCTRGHPLEVSR